MATITANVTTANWNVNSTWVGSVQPTAADDVIIPASAVITIPTATTVLGRSVTVAATGTLAFASTTAVLTIGDGTAGTGNVAFSNAGTITLTGIGTINFVSTSATTQTVTSGGQTLPNLTVNGTGNSIQFADNITSTGAITHTLGTLDTNGKTVTATSLVSIGSSTRTLTLGASAITLSAATAINFTSTGLTMTANTASITASLGTSMIGGSVNFNGASLTTTGANPVITNAGTWNNMTVTGTAVKTCSITFTTTGVTCTGTFTCNGNSAINRVWVISGTVGTPVTITAATVSVSNIDMMDITGAGAGSWNIAACTGNSGDCQGNSGITFTTPATQTFTSGTKNWSDNTVWTSRVPLPQDDVIVNTTTATTLTIDMPRLGKNVNFTSFNKTASVAAAVSVYGSLTLSNSMTYTVNNTQAVTLRGRSSYTLTGAGLTWSTNNNFTFTITAPGGTYTAQDALILTSNTSSTSGLLQITNGTFVDGGYSHTVGSVNISGTTTRGLTKTGNWSILTISAATVWTATTTTGLTFSDSGTTTISNASVSSRTWAGGGLTYGTLTYTVAGSTGSLVISGSNYFDTLNFSDATNARTLSLTASVVQTVRVFNVNGTAGKLMSVISATGGTQAQLALVGAVNTNDYLSVQDINSSLPYKFYAGVNSTNVSGNTNVIFTAKVTQPYATWSSDINITGVVSTMSITPSFAHTATAGNLLILGVTWGASNPGAITSAPTGYTLIDANSATSAAYTNLYYKVATGGETTASISWTNSIGNNSMRITEIAGWSGTPTLDVKDKNNSAASSVTTLSSGTGVTNSAQPAFAYAYFSGNGSLGALVSITNSFQEERQVAVASTNGRSFGLPLISTGSQTTTFTWTTSRQASSQLAVFKDVTSVVTAVGSTMLLMGVG